jgi:hypothetical protein
MMLSSASRQFRHVGRRVVASRGLARHAARASSSSSLYWAAAGAAAITVAGSAIQRTSLDGPPPIEEKATGILFPKLEGALSFVGCGVRVKYGFIKVRV